MNKQETFDYVVNHLYKQGRPALNDKGDCMYRTSDGLMCAVGCLIPDSMYHKAMEFTEVPSIVDRFELPGEIEEYQKMLHSLQRVHDDWEYLSSGGEFKFSDIEYKLQRVADNHDVHYNPPEE